MKERKHKYQLLLHIPEVNTDFMEEIVTAPQHPDSPSKLKETWDLPGPRDT